MPFAVPEPPSNCTNRWRRQECTGLPAQRHSLGHPHLGSLLANNNQHTTNNSSSSNTKTIRAVCLLVHAEGWHSGYFAGLAGRLNREGIYCAAYDQTGMGYSQLYNSQG